MTSIFDQTGRVLVVDDDEDVLMAAKLLLKQHVASVYTETDPTRIQDHLARNDFDIILLDMNFTRDVTSGEEGLNWLQKIVRTDPNAVVIMITAFGDAEIAVKAIKAGATDFVAKPWHNEKLIATVSAALKLRISRREVSDLRERQEFLAADLDLPFGEFIGDCPAMHEVFTIIEKVAGTDANVLITGENGTGKELAARAVHRQSNRHSDVFVKVDMGAITESLFESELFGHVKGAFTDARKDRAGRFEIAAGGTLLLDEIGNLPLTLQPKLLTALQSRQVTRVGSNNARPVDIRLVCASNLSLEDLVEQKRFRQDLLYRINTVEIHLPPLRDRVEDIAVLAEHFLRVYATKYRKEVIAISPAGLSKLKRQRWAGNVRELQHAIERAVIMSDGSTLEPDDFPFGFKTGSPESEALESLNLEKVEKAVIERVLAIHGGNISHAAKELGLTRTSLYRRMQKHDL